MEIKSLALFDKTTKRELVYSVIIIIIIGALFIYEHQRQSLAAYSPKIINIAGKQRMLSQRISYLQHLAVTDAGNQLRSTWQAEMRLLLDEFKRSHDILTGQAPLNDGHVLPLSDELREFYFEGTNALDAEVNTFLLVNRDISSATGNDYLSFYTPEQTAAILGQLDTAVTLHEKQSRELNKNAGIALTLLWLFGLALLFLFLRIIMRPLKKTIEEQKNAQIETTAELAYTKEELEHQIIASQPFDGLCSDIIDHTWGK